MIYTAKFLCRNLTNVMLATYLSEWAKVDEQVSNLLALQKKVLKRVNAAVQSKGNRSFSEILNETTDVSCCDDASDCKIPQPTSSLQDRQKGAAAAKESAMKMLESQLKCKTRDTAWCLLESENTHHLIGFRKKNLVKMKISLGKESDGTPIVSSVDFAIGELWDYDTNIDQIVLTGLCMATQPYANGSADNVPKIIDAVVDTLDRYRPLVRDLLNIALCLDVMDSVSSFRVLIINCSSGTEFYLCGTIVHDVEHPPRLTLTSQHVFGKDVSVTVKDIIDRCRSMTNPIQSTLRKLVSPAVLLP